MLLVGFRTSLRGIISLRAFGIPRGGLLCQQRFYNRAAHICEPEFAPLKFIGQAHVIDTQTVQQGRLKIMDVNRILRDVVTVIVGFTIRQSRPHAATCHPHGETSAMMIAAVLRGREAALTVHRASELTTPND